VRAPLLDGTAHDTADDPALADAGCDELRASLRADRDPEATPVRLLIDRSGFTAWARGAAAVAIQATFV